MLPLDEQSCEDQTFVIIEYVEMWYITVILIKNPSDMQKNPKNTPNKQHTSLLNTYRPDML